MPRANELRACLTAPGAWARRWIAPLAIVCLSGCAHKGAAPAPATAATTPQARLAWLPLEPLLAADVAKMVNAHLGRLPVAGTTRYRAPVSMEMAQLALECIDPTPACYTAVGRSVGADRLLWAEVGPAPAAGQGLRVAVVLFDVRGSAVLRRTEQTYDGLQAVRAGVAALIDHALDVSGPVVATSAGKAAGGSKTP